MALRKPLQKVFILLILLVRTVATYGQTEYLEVVVEGIPNNIDDFLNLRNRLAYNPDGGVAIFVLAMAMYTQDESLGMDAFTIALDRFNLISVSVGGYKGYQPSKTFMLRAKNYLLPRPYIAFSYFQGTKPEERYVLFQKRNTILISQNAYSYINEAEVKLYVHSTGAEAPRPIVLRKNNRGIWKVKSHSLFLGVLPPVERQIDDDI